MTETDQAIAARAARWARTHPRTAPEEPRSPLEDDPKRLARMRRRVTQALTASP